jgi:hypothetical protein
VGTDLVTKRHEDSSATSTIPGPAQSDDAMGVQMLEDPLVDPLQASSHMMGTASQVQLEVDDPAKECGNYKERYADPAPYAWSVSYKYTVPGAGRGAKTGKGKRKIAASFNHATLNKSNDNPKVSMLLGTLTSADQEGRGEPVVTSEELMVTVAQNTARFTEAMADAKRYSKGKLKVTKPKEDREADVESCS